VGAGYRDRPALSLARALGEERQSWLIAGLLGRAHALERTAVALEALGLVLAERPDLARQVAIELLARGSDLVEQLDHAVPGVRLTVTTIEELAARLGQDPTEDEVRAAAKQLQLGIAGSPGKRVRRDLERVVRALAAVSDPACPRALEVLARAGVSIDRAGPRGLRPIELAMRAGAQDNALAGAHTGAEPDARRPGAGRPLHCDRGAPQAMSAARGEDPSRGNQARGRSRTVSAGVCPATASSPVLAEAAMRGR